MKVTIGKWNSVIMDQKRKAMRQQMKAKKKKCKIKLESKIPTGQEKNEKKDNSRENWN
jgi:hypothetical protein